MGMDLDTEISVRQNLQEAAEQADSTLKKGQHLLNKAESDMADAVANAKKAGANVSFIANATGLSRQKVYIFLAMRGIRPGGNNGGGTDG